MKNYVVEKLNYEFTISTRGVRRNPKLETLPFYRITISSTILLSVEFVLKKLKTTILLSYHFVKRGLYSDAFIEDRGESALPPGKVLDLTFFVVNIFC